MRSWSTAALAATASALALGLRLELGDPLRDARVIIFSASAWASSTSDTSRVTSLTNCSTCPSVSVTSAGMVPPSGSSSSTRSIRPKSLGSAPARKSCGLKVFVTAPAMSPIGPVPAEMARTGRSGERNPPALSLPAPLAPKETDRGFEVGSALGWAPFGS